MAKNFDHVNRFNQRLAQGITRGTFPHLDELADWLAAEGDIEKSAQRWAQTTSLLVVMTLLDRKFAERVEQGLSLGAELLFGAEASEPEPSQV